MWTRLRTASGQRSALLIHSDLKAAKITMRTFLVFAVLIALLAVGAESFRLPRDAEEEGTVTRVLDSVKSYYDQAVTKASEYLESIKGLKLEEKAKNLFDETTTAVKTYAIIFQDQAMHMFQSH
ncbi:hypothetical protein ACEWY4_019792 [Coilia grayii]|uniref:Apolipoprotein C-II n=1 Tax=Coilia grayii TaxID=363190 RepID=A0ABD1JAS6_9TELE